MCFTEHIIWGGCGCEAGKRRVQCHQHLVAVMEGTGKTMSDPCVMGVKIRDQSRKFGTLKTLCPKCKDSSKWADLTQELQGAGGEKNRDVEAQKPTGVKRRWCNWSWPQWCNWPWP